jgi:hypothetical protein
MLRKLRVTSRWRNPRSSRSPVGLSVKPGAELLPGCAVPRHNWCLLSHTSPDGYFQVAESKITVSQVISVLLASPYGLAVSKTGYFQVAESQVICALQVSSLVSVVQDLELLPGGGIPGHQCAPCISIGGHRLGETGYFQVALSHVISGLLLSVRYFQVADSNAIASHVTVEMPFSRAVDGVLAGFGGIPGHVSSPIVPANQGCKA